MAQARWREPILILAVALVAGGGLTSGWPLTAQTSNAPAPPRVSTVNLAEGVYLVTASRTGTVNAVFAAGPDGVLVVDTMTGPLSSLLRSEIAKVSEAPVRIVVNTHWHGDHVGGNRDFAPAAIFAHPRVRARISREQILPWMPEPVAPESETAWPTVTLHGPASVHFNGEEIRLIPVPGAHTDGDVVAIFTKSNVVCIGDVMHFAGGRLMPGSSTFSGGNLRTLRQRLTALLPHLTAAARVVPGHGPVLARDDVDAHGLIIDAVLAYVDNAKRAGRTADQLKAAGMPAGIVALSRWPLSEAAWIQAAYDAAGESEPALPVTAEAFITTFRAAEGITFNARGELFIGANRGIWIATPDGTARRIADVETHLGQAGIGARDILAADFGPRSVFQHEANDDGVVWRISPEGTTVPAARGIADPNFILVLEDGTFLVSDDGTHAIYHVGAGGDVRVWSRAIPYPNGMALSPDGSTLYVAQIFSSLDPAVPSDRLWALPVAGGEPAGPPRVVARTGGGGLDGLALDARGRVYVADNGTGRSGASILTRGISRS